MLLQLTERVFATEMGCISQFYQPNLDEYVSDCDNRSLPLYLTRLILGLFG